MSHTPGPWEVHPNYARSIRSKDGTIVASAAYHKGVPGTKRPTEEQIPHNARLIAESPKMLKALEYVQENWLERPAWIDEAIRKVKEN